MVLGKPEQCGWAPVLPTKPAYSFGHKHPFHGASSPRHSWCDGGTVVPAEASASARGRMSLTTGQHGTVVRQSMIWTRILDSRASSTTMATLVARSSVEQHGTDIRLSACSRGYAGWLPHTLRLQWPRQRAALGQGPGPQATFREGRPTTAHRRVPRRHVAQCCSARGPAAAASCCKSRETALTRSGLIHGAPHV